jgi:hypothetical protein
MPSGFIASKLVEECYQPVKDRDDEALFQALEAIRNRLNGSLDVYHPIIRGERISDGNEAAMREIKSRLEEAVNDLYVLNNPQCTRQEAIKAWKKFFNHSYFEECLRVGNAEIITPIVIADRKPEKAVERHGEARFG